MSKDNRIKTRQTKVIENLIKYGGSSLAALLVVSGSLALGIHHKDNEVKEKDAVIEALQKELEALESLNDISGLKLVGHDGSKEITFRESQETEGKYILQYNDGGMTVNAGLSKIIHNKEEEGIKFDKEVLKELSKKGVSSFFIEDKGYSNDKEFMNEDGNFAEIYPMWDKEGNDMTGIAVFVGDEGEEEVIILNGDECFETEENMEQDFE